jgi:SagB-type dehydrogenase family enzyme
MSTKAGKQFIHDSIHRYMDKSAEEVGQPQPPLESVLETFQKVIDLPSAGQLSLPAADMWQVMQKRKTLRHYQNTALNLDELAALLWFSQGVKNVTDRPVTMRTVPSGGARHPFETYLLVNRVDGLEPGLYRYMAFEHKLGLIKAGAELAEELGETIVHQHHVRDCAVSFWWAVETYRTTWRYGTRGYRYFMMDAGHVCQNLILAAEAFDCGVCAIGSFDDEGINPFFNLDGQERFILYGATVGKR